MTAVDLTTSTDLDVIADLDFVPTLPCEHSQHETHHADEPASWVAHFMCPACGRDSTYLICDSGRRHILRGARCVKCGDSRGPSEIQVTFRPIGTAS